MLNQESMGYIIPYMASERIFYRKNVRSDGSIVEMKIWEVPKTKDKPFGYSYSLVFVRDGKRIIGYDNGEGKGDHKHCGNRECPYEFKGMDVLIEDFYMDVLKVEGGEL
jgi:hypothetical protein